jgi:hypothetical protein
METMFAHWRPPRYPVLAPNSENDMNMEEAYKGKPKGKAKATPKALQGSWHFLSPPQVGANEGHRNSGQEGTDDQTEPMIPSRIKYRRRDNQNADPSKKGSNDGEKWKDEPQADSSRLPAKSPNFPPEKR